MHNDELESFLLQFLRETVCDDDIGFNLASKLDDPEVKVQDFVDKWCKEQL